MIKKGLIFVFVLVLTACAVKPTALNVDERYQEAQRDVQELFSPQKNISRHIDYYEALARALKYNLDYRIKLANYALQADQLKVAEFTMFPALNTSGSVYTRNNDLASFGITSTGQPTDVLNSTPRTLRSARVALSWNILDFGLGYVRAKQQGERLLIAQEESRKQEQQLAQDVLVSYWEAYNAQELIQDTKQFQSLLTTAKNRLVAATRDKLVPQENILNFQAALLEGNRRLVQLQYKYNKALLDLRRLLSLPPDQDLILAPPPHALHTAQDLRSLDFEKLDAIALVKRPELRGQEYQKKIAELGVDIAILQALPGITLNEGWNYNSNKFLINNRWIDKSMDVAWNLLNLASLPTSYSAAKIGVQYEKLKRMALTVTVLTEVRYSYWHYKSINDEYQLAHKQTLNAQAIYTLNRNRQIASLASDQQVILAKLKYITSKMDEQILLSDLSTALGELYLSSGSDILPIDVDNRSIPELRTLIEKNFVLENTLNFTQYVDNVYHNIFEKPQQKQHYYAQPKPQSRPVTTGKPLGLRLAEAFKMGPFAHKENKLVTQIKPVILQAAAQHKTQITQIPSPQKYAVQVFSARNLSLVKNFQTSLPANLTSQIGETIVNAQTWYVLTVGQYQTATAAKDKIQKLPKKYRDASAWVRRTENVKWIA